MTERKHNAYVQIIREPSPNMAPQDPPPLPPSFAARVFPEAPLRLEGIRAVAFDIYGTLFTSAAGDIAAGISYAKGNLEALALQFAEDTTGEELKAFFRTAVMEEHGNLYPKTPYPEVRVEEIWAFLPKRYPDRDPAELALRYELAVNPVAPMPSAEECLAALRSAGLYLGIVSNAQFYTPLLFEAFFGAGTDSLGFDPELCVYSYEHRRAKPSPELFARLAEALARRGIEPAECLYIGNDMLNDIYGAADSGFKTALFAGDGRSLRLRENNRLCRDLLPDAVIRELRFLPALVSPAERHE